MDKIWGLIEEYAERGLKDGGLERKRAGQNRSWLRQRMEYLLTSGFFQDLKMQEAYSEMEQKVAREEISPFQAAAELYRIYLSGRPADGKGNEKK